MTAAARNITALLVAMLALAGSPGWAGQQALPSSSSDDLLLPFSSSLVLPGAAAQGPARLKHLVERLDTVRSADIQVSGPADHPQVMVLVTWRSRDAAIGPVVDLIVSLALHTIPGLSAAGLVVADSSGAVHYDGARPGSVSDQSLGLAGRPVALAVAVAAGIVFLILLVGLAARRRSSLLDAPRPVPRPLAGRSARDLVALLQAASPGVRGAVLVSLPEKLRHRLARMLGGRVDWPERAPDPPVLVAVVDALRTTGGSQ